MTGTEAAGPAAPAGPPDVAVRSPLPPAAAPAATGAAPALGVLVALLLVTVGVVGVEEGLQRAELVRVSWTSWLLQHGAATSAGPVVLVTSLALCVLGAAVLVIALRPRPRRTVRLDATTGVHLRARDLGTMARDRIDGASGVTGVETSATRRRLRVRVTTIGPREADPELVSEVRTRLRPLGDALASAPRVVVAVSHEDHT